MESRCQKPGVNEMKNIGQMAEDDVGPQVNDVVAKRNEDTMSE